MSSNYAINNIIVLHLWLRIIWFVNVWMFFCWLCKEIQTKSTLIHIIQSSGLYSLGDQSEYWVLWTEPCKTFNTFNRAAHLPAVTLKWSQWNASLTIIQRYILCWNGRVLLLLKVYFCTKIAYHLLCHAWSKYK